MRAVARAMRWMRSRQVAMNREEVDHGCSPEEESEEVEIQKEGQEGRAEKEESSATLQSEEEGGAEKEENRAEEGCGQKETRA